MNSKLLPLLKVEVFSQKVTQGLLASAAIFLMPI